MKITVIETRSENGAYAMNCKSAIIDHPKHGRLYISQEFGGMHTLAGGKYRWSSGIVIKLLADDTFQSLSNKMYNETETVLNAATNACCDDRPILEWDGNMIDSVASAAGL